MAPILENLVQKTVSKAITKGLKREKTEPAEPEAVESRFVSTRFMIISDTHDLTLNDAAIDTPFKEPFPEADVVLHCGGLTLGGGIENYEKALEMLSKIDAELKLVIAGSRDLSLDPKFWKEHTASGDCDCDPMESEIALSTMAKAKDSNIRYLEEGKHEFASPYTPSSYHPQTKLHEDARAFTYDPSDDTYCDRFNETGGDPRDTPFPDVDLLMTHGAPDNFTDDTWSPPKATVHDLTPPNDLRYVVPRLGPRIHCFGHHRMGYGMRIVNWEFKEKAGPGEYGPATWNMAHETLYGVQNPYPEAIEMGDYGLDKHTGYQTLFVNACIMDTDDKPTRAPWVLAMDLPRGKENRIERESLPFIHS